MDLKASTSVKMDIVSDDELTQSLTIAVAYSLLSEKLNPAGGIGKNNRKVHALGLIMYRYS